MLLRNAFVDGDYYGNGVSMSVVQKDGRWSKPQMLKIKNYYNSPQEVLSILAHVSERWHRMKNMKTIIS